MGTMAAAPIAVAAPAVTTTVYRGGLLGGLGLHGGLGLAAGHGIWKREADAEPEADASLGYGYGAIAAAPIAAAPIAVAAPAVTTTVYRGGLLGGLGLRGG